MGASSYFPFPLSESPASFQAGVLGVMARSANGKLYQFVKNTDAAVLSPGMVVEWEDASAFGVDKAATGTADIAGVVVNDLTGTTVAVNDGFWIQKSGNCYCLYEGSGNTAVTAELPVIPAAGYVEGAGTATSVKSVLAAFAIAQSAATTNKPAGTQIEVMLIERT